MSQDDVVALLTSHDELAASHDELTESYAQLTRDQEALRRQLEWLKRQVFGAKADRRLPLPEEQLTLGAMGTEPTTAVPTHLVGPHQRRRPQPPATAGESGVRFDPSVPVKVIEVPNPELADLPPESYTTIREVVTERLVQKPSTFEVHRYVRQVVKLEDGKLSCPPAPPAVLDRCLADVSLLANLVVDKVRYHLPLYRQHQRMAAAGVRLSRPTLTNWFHGTAELLVPIHKAQMASILESDVLLMDETPIRAGPGKQKGRMKTGYFWPVLGDRGEIAFPFAPTRGHQVVVDMLGGFANTLVTDGYAAYDKYAERVRGLVHAQCWAHTRRNFVEAEASEPVLCGRVLDLVTELYEHEATSRNWEDAKRQIHRAEHAKPVVDRIFAELKQAFEDRILLPKSPFTQAANYALEREAGLRVFLGDPRVPVDTNAVERQIRPVAIGRRNWLFTWTEVGAKYVGILQSLISTCRLQGVDPYTYLVDVLQRIDSHPQSLVHQLTPRLWKERFADDPLRSLADLRQ
jgi:transposase